MNTGFGYDYTTRTHLLVSDEDAADFLQSQFTNELRPVEAGRCTYGLWLNVKGKVIADSYVLCEGEEQFRLFSETSESAVVAETLENHIIADDVVIESEPALVGVAIVGNMVDSVLRELNLNSPQAGRFESAEGCVVFQGRRSRAGSVEVICLSSVAAVRVRAVLSQLGVPMVSSAQMTAERIEAGYPQVPIEVGPTDLPGEGGLELDSVSFTKGCYLGQEVVARMHNLGRPQRTLFVVSGEGVVPECPLALYNGEAKKVGELRTAVARADGWVGAAMLKHRFAKVGDRLVSDLCELLVERAFRGGGGDL